MGKKLLVHKLRRCSAATFYIDPLSHEHYFINMILYTCIYEMDFISMKQY